MPTFVRCAVLTVVFYADLLFCKTVVECFMSGREPLLNCGLGNASSARHVPLQRTTAGRPTCRQSAFETARTLEPAASYPRMVAQHRGTQAATFIPLQRSTCNTIQQHLDGHRVHDHSIGIRDWTDLSVLFGPRAKKERRKLRRRPVDCARHPVQRCVPLEDVTALPSPAIAASTYMICPLRPRLDGSAFPSLPPT